MWATIKRLVEPTDAISDVGERRRARILASVVFACVPLGLVTIVIQLLTRPGFLSTFLSNGAALLLLGGLGYLARTRHYRLAAGASAVVVVLACAAAGLNDPSDPVWWAYALLAVLLASILISIRGAALIAVVALAAIVGVHIVNGAASDRIVASAMFHVVVSPVLLVMAHHRNLLEEDRRSQLAFNQELLQIAQGVAKLAHWRWRREDDVLDVSLALERILGLPPGETNIDVLITCFDDAHGREALRDGLQRIDEHALSLELAFTRDDGAERFSIVTAELQEQDGERVVIGTVQDVTDRVLAQTEKHALQEQLHEAQRLETVGRIAGGIAHDFNNLLTVIMSSSELARDSRGEELEQILGEIEVASERGRRLTRQLLAYARKQVLAPTHLDLQAVATAMQPILERLAGRPKLQVARDGDGSATVTADRSQVEQVLLNLVINASVATSENGRIEIRTGVVDSGPADTVLEDQPCAYLVVSDDGSGMPDEIRARAFEPFYTTKAETGGTGLGLSTVYGIVHQSGGCIEVDSADGVGTTFRMFFPHSIGDQTTVSSKVPAAELPDGLRLLIVDDEVAVLRSVARMLQRAGYDVTQAHGPAEAKRLWREKRGEIDLVLSDVVMPVTDGVELVTGFMSEAPDLRVVLMSGFSASTIEKHGFHSSDIPMLRKPFSQDELFSKLRATRAS